MLLRKRNVQQLFWSKLNLRVNIPKVRRFGSTNDGSTSRRAFEEHEKFSEITGMDKILIFRLKKSFLYVYHANYHLILISLKIIVWKPQFAFNKNMTGYQ